MNDAETPAPAAPKPCRKLADAHKEFIVRRLAAYDGPTMVMRELYETFGVTVCRQTVTQYDPTRFPGCPRRWTELFFATRKAMLERRVERAVESNRAERTQRERLVLRSVDLLAARILTTVKAEGRDLMAKPADEISDADRLRALIAFAEKLRKSNAQGYAALRAALVAPPETGASAGAGTPAEALHGE